MVRIQVEFSLSIIKYIKISALKGIILPDMVIKRENVLADYRWILLTFGFTGILQAQPVSTAIAVGLRHTRHSYLASDF